MSEGLLDAHDERVTKIDGIKRKEEDGDEAPKRRAEPREKDRCKGDN